MSSFSSSIKIHQIPVKSQHLECWRFFLFASVIYWDKLQIDFWAKPQPDGSYLKLFSA